MTTEHHSTTFSDDEYKHDFVNAQNYSDPKDRYYVPQQIKDETSTTVDDTQNSNLIKYLEQ